MRSQTGAMATWLKVVLALVGLGIAATIGIVVLGVSMLGELGKTATDPQKAAKIADEIVQIRRPLPSEWQYAVGMNMGVMKMAMLRNSSNNVVVNLTRYPKSSKVESITQGAAAGAHMSVEERGEETLAGRKMSYLRGFSKGRGGSAAMAMEMAWVIANNGDLILIHCVEPGKSKFEKEPVAPVLDRVVGFP